LIQTGGSIQNNDELWFGQGATGVGAWEMSGGSLQVANWVAIGREGGSGTFNMSGGTVTKVGNGNFIVAASGPGTMNHSGGLVDIQGGITWVAEGNNATGNYTISGSAEHRTSQFVMAVNGGTTANVNFDGGTLRVGRIGGGGGTENVSFNGTQIIATAPGNAFIELLQDAQIGAGNLRIDSNGHNIRSPQSFTGTGGVEKSGAGTLTLTGVNSFTGPSTVTGGKLVIGAIFSPELGSVSVANGTTFGVFQEFGDESVNLSSLTMGTTGATSLDLDLGEDLHNPAEAALKVNGTLTLNGTVTVNIADAQPALGSFPIITYAGAKAGSGSFVLGTLPNGVAATLSDNGTGTVTLNITSISMPVCTGAQSNIWDTTTQNWIDLVSGSPIVFADGAPVLFDDTATGSTDVVLNSTVAPSGVTFNNSNLPYTLTGTGKITGSTGLLVKGSAPVTITGLQNDHTGVTRIEEGILSVNLLANGGQPSPIGASSADPANLALAGGTLRYTGPSVTIDRGFRLEAAGSGLSHDNNITLGGSIATVIGGFVKTGGGDLTLNSPAPNVMGSPGVINQIQGGRLIVNGTLNVGGELWVASVPDIPAHLVVNSGSLTTGSWLTLGRGNGDTGVVSTLTATNSTIQNVNFSTGFANNLPNASEQVITLTNTNWTNNGQTLLAEGANSTTTMVIGGTSAYVAATNTNESRFLMGLGENSRAEVIIQDSGSLTKTGGWLAIGNSSNGEGIMTVKDNGSLTSNGDFNVGDVGTSKGTLNIQDNATVTSTGIAFIGKNTGTSGTVNQTGGTFTGATWIPIGRFADSAGVWNISGGTLNMTNAGQALHVGEEGNGTLNISGTAQVNVTGTVNVSSGATGVGTLNLNGGTLTAQRVVEGAGGAGSGTINFNGGTLRAGANSDTAFMTAIDNANILAGGAFIDSNGRDITISAALTGFGALTKTGTGTLTLSGANAYFGNTTVAAGTLSLTGPTLGETSTVNIASGAVLNLNYTGSDQVTGLTIGGVSLAAGTYSAVTHPGVITGSGELVVTGGTTPSGYDTWAQNNGLNSGNNGPLQDPDNDGIANLLEFVFGGNPLASDPSILPQLSLTSTHFVFTFNRADESEAETVQTFQWGTNLTAWNDVTVGGTSSGPNANGVTVTVAEGSPASTPDVITVSVPRSNAANGMIYGRLRVQKP
jgi:autotransporter-associated beta strand protein/T5SS/PEP-CTERM-associated repeat protein